MGYLLLSLGFLSLTLSVLAIFKVIEDPTCILYKILIVVAIVVLMCLAVYLFNAGIAIIMKIDKIC